MVQLAPLTGQVRVNTTTSNQQNTSTVAALADGGYVILYRNAGSSFQDILGQRFTAAGSPVGTEFTVKSDGAGSPTPFFDSVTGLTTGGFVAAWRDIGSTSAITLQRFDASGTKIGGELTASTAATAAVTSTASVTKLDGGGFVVAWSATIGSSIETYGRVYNASGTPAGGEFLLNTSLAGTQNDVSVARIPFGFVATWVSGSQINAQVFTSAGVKAGAEFQVGAGSVAQTDPDVVALEGGGFVITYVQGAGGSVEHVMAQRYDASGLAAGAPIDVAASRTTNGIAETSVTPLPGGGFVVTYVDVNGFPDQQIMARPYAAGGIPLSAAFTINEVTDPNAFINPDAAATLANGNIVFTWYGRGPTDTTGSYMRLYAVQSEGPTQGDDNLIGTPAGEAINALGGNDVITGGGGADALTGGPGFDTFRYTAASDSTSVASDAITDFATGIDRIDFAAVTPTSIAVVQVGSVSAVFANTPGGAMQVSVTGDVEASDITTGGIGVTVQGGAASTALTGSPYKDNLFGEAGNDLLVGRLGADVLFGGAGADLFYYPDAADSTGAAADLIADFQPGLDAIDLSPVHPTAISIIQAGGNSLIFANTPGGAMQIGVLGTVQGGGVVTGGIGVVIQGGSASTIVTGSASNDTLFGEAGNDVLIGGLGVDVLFGGAGFDTFKYQVPVESNAAAPDLIADFQTGIDKIDLRGTGITAVGIASGTVFGSGPGGATMQIGVIGAITLADILTGAAPAPAPLSAESFSHFHGMDGVLV